MFSFMMLGLKVRASCGREGEREILRRGFVVDVC